MLVPLNLDVEPLSACEDYPQAGDSF